MENQTQVPYIVHEGIVVRLERQLKRMWIAIIIAVVALLGCNVAWLLYLNQYDFQSYDYDVSTVGGGNANFIGQDGDIYNGTGESETQGSEEEKRQVKRHGDKTQEEVTACPSMNCPTARLHIS